MTSRQLMNKCLTFDGPDRIPVHLWTLPWAEESFPEDTAELRRRYPNDIVSAPGVNRPSPRAQGDPYRVGTYTDEWGCTFVNVHGGIIGEVKEPQVAEVADWRAVEPPFEILPEDPGKAKDQVNRFCAETDRFVMGGCCPRPWERYQFLRGSVDALMDVMDPDSNVRGLLELIHGYYLRELELWVDTDVDAVMFMDDWGAQSQLLIPPPVWQELFKPLYADYCRMAHEAGKFIFMHSDGHITEIYPDLIEVGVDAANSQLFCMDLGELARIAKGRITFWGEIDRQQVLPSPDPDVAREAVRRVADHLYDPSGGIIAQLEFGAGARPENVFAVFEEWEKVHASRP